MGEWSTMQDFKFNFVSEMMVKKIGMEKAQIAEEFCLCLESNKAYKEPLEVIKVLFDIYAADCSSKWCVPLTADAISKMYNSSYNNPYYTTDILSNMRAIL
jgi:hypothetical protein